MAKKRKKTVIKLRSKKPTKLSFEQITENLGGFSQEKSGRVVHINSEKDTTIKMSTAEWRSLCRKIRRSK